MSGARRTPPRDCPLCPRLVDFREANRRAHPAWFNAPVPAFGDPAAGLLIVGLAPGRRGANRTGRPFTGDHAGEILYRTLLRFGFARGDYGADPGDGLELVGCRVVNAVRCVPPENRPAAGEVTNCRQFLEDELVVAPRPRVVVPLGSIAHGTVLKALGLAERSFPFRHGAWYDPDGGPAIASCYHCSRQNLNTGRLTTAMFETVFERVAAALAAA